MRRLSTIVLTTSLLACSIGSSIAIWHSAPAQRYRAAQQFQPVFEGAETQAGELRRYLDGIERRRANADQILDQEQRDRIAALTHEIRTDYARCIATLAAQHDAFSQGDYTTIDSALHEDCTQQSAMPELERLLHEADSARETAVKQTGDAKKTYQTLITAQKDLQSTMHTSGYVVAQIERKSLQELIERTEQLARGTLSTLNTNLQILGLTPIEDTGTMLEREGAYRAIDIEELNTAAATLAARASELRQQEAIRDEIISAQSRIRNAVDKDLPSDSYERIVRCGATDEIKGTAEQLFERAKRLQRTAREESKKLPVYAPDRHDGTLTRKEYTEWQQEQNRVLQLIS